MKLLFLVYKLVIGIDKSFTVSCTRNVKYNKHSEVVHNYSGLRILF